LFQPASHRKDLDVLVTLISELTAEQATDWHHSVPEQCRDDFGIFGEQRFDLSPVIIEGIKRQIDRVMI
jgi:hypothetical protein